MVESLASPMLPTPTFLIRLAHTGILVAIAGLTAASASAAQSFDVSFEEVTETVFGTVPTGSSFGAGAWGDMDRDGDPDLWLGNHALDLALWVNQGAAGFQNELLEMMPGALAADSHGAAWADFDGDGDLDLLECVGASLGAGIGPNRLWLNRSPHPFAEVGKLAGLDFPAGRSRSPLWVDWNLDGRMDVVVTAFPSSQSQDRLFTQTATGQFVDTTAQAGFLGTGVNTRFGQLGDYDSDGQMEMLLQSRTFPDSAMEFDTGGFRELALPPGFQPLANVQDVVVGDFDNDLDMDFYLAREPYWSGNEVGIADDGSLRIATRIKAGTSRLQFRCKGNLWIETIVGFPPDRFLLGVDRVPAQRMPLLVRNHDKNVIGINAGDESDGEAVYLGRESDSAVWDCVFASPVDFNGAMIIRSDQPIEVVRIFDIREREDSPDVMFWSDPDHPDFSIPDEDFEGRAAACGDFDNDGDLDLYVVYTGAALNRVNRLYENQGGGEFVVVPGAAGAEGSRLGVGDGVSVVDYDQDGFLDLLVTNGAGIRPLSNEGPVQLFRNRGGNGNHWLQIDLVGSRDTRDAIGAVVEVTTAGGTQRRDQTGGMTRATQHHTRLHFGLGTEPRIDRILVTWPDGSKQEMRDVLADQILVIEQR